MWVINKRNLCLTVLGARKTKIKELTDLVSGMSPFPDSQTDMFLLCPHKAKGIKELSTVTFVRALIPFMGTPALMT